MLDKAQDQTAPQLRQALKRAVLRVDPDGAQARHQQRRQDRRIVVSPAEDGMAELFAYLPAPAAITIYDTVNALARRAATPGDRRSAEQRRADAFVDLVLGEQTTGPVTRPSEKCELDQPHRIPRGSHLRRHHGHLCVHHHQLKHRSTWRGDRLANGDYW